MTTKEMVVKGAESTLSFGATLLASFIGCTAFCMIVLACFTSMAYEKKFDKDVAEAKEAYQKAEAVNQHVTIQMSAFIAEQKLAAEAKPEIEKSGFWRRK